MTDPVCLLDSSADDFERALLGSAQRDVGSPAARARCLAAVGPAVAVLATSHTSSAAVLLSVLKAVGVGVVLGTVASGAAYFVTAERDTNANGAAARSSQHGAQRARSVTASAPAVPGGAPAPAVTPGGPVSTSELDASAASPAARASARGEIVPKTQALPAPPAALDHSLELEVQALDHARQALAAGDSAAALAALDRHGREFPHGVLLPESVFLRVRALLAAGRRSEAGAFGRRFLATHSGGDALKLSQLLEQEGLR